MNILLIFFTQTACIKKDFLYHMVNVDDAKYLKSVNTTIASLRSLIPTDGSVYRIPDTAGWVIQGIVVSNDRNGNFYKCIHIQDSTAGIQLMINASKTYATYPPGMRIFVKLAGLGLVSSFGQGQLGLYDNSTNTMIAIPQFITNHYIVKGSLNHAVDTLEISDITVLSSIHQSRLVKLYNVMIDTAYAGKKTMGDIVSNSYNYFVPVWDSRKTAINLLTSPYATFANQTVPIGAGYMIGVFTQNVFASSVTNQINVGSMSDIYFNAHATIILDTIIPSNFKIKSISEVRSYYTGNPARLPIANDTAIRGFVISDNTYKNMPDSQLLIQQPNDKSICILLNNAANNFNVGDELIINLKGAVLTKNNAGKIVASFSTKDGAMGKSPQVVLKSINNTVTAIPINMDMLTADLAMDNPQYEAQLVTINNAYFASKQNSPFKGSSSITLKQQGNNGQILFYTRALYGGTNKVPLGLCNITALVVRYYGGYELIIRTPNDVQDLNTPVSDGSILPDGDYSIAQIKPLYKGSDYTITAALGNQVRMTGIVISNRSYNILPGAGKIAIIQTPGGGPGIHLLFNAAHSLNVGDKITINIVGATLTTAVTGLYGVLGINLSSVTNPILNILPASSIPINEKIVPQIVTLSQLNANFNDYLSQLVEIKNVAFAVAQQNKKYTTSPVTKKIGYNTDSFNVYTYSTQTGATIASSNTPIGNFDLIAIPVNNTTNTPSLYVQQPPSTNLRVVATPTISPNGGTFTTAQNITIATTESTAQIYYTTDGSDPATSNTAISSSSNSIIFPLSSSATIRAVAMAPGLQNSSETSANFIFNTATSDSANWNFNTNSVITTPITNNGTNDKIIHATLSLGNQVASTLTYTSGGISANNWGTAAVLNGQYWLFKLPSLTIKNSITVAFKTGGSATGPNDWNIEYSFDNFTTIAGSKTYTIGSSTSSTNIAQSFTFNVNAPITSEVYIRLLPTSITSISGGNIGSTGTNRLNNITITIN